MAYILRALMFGTFVFFALTLSNALGWFEITSSHIIMAIPFILVLIFVQAFVMFYFIGVNRLVTNIHIKLDEGKNLGELFDDGAPEDLMPYRKRVYRYYKNSDMAKKKVIPWTMLTLFLGILGFLLGGAHHTGVVDRIIHSGVIYGFLAAYLIGFAKQWKYLGQNHFLLRELKKLFSLSDHTM